MMFHNFRLLIILEKLYNYMKRNFFVKVSGTLIIIALEKHKKIKILRTLIRCIKIILETMVLNRDDTFSREFHH